MIDTIVYEVHIASLDDRSWVGAFYQSPFAL